MRDVMSKHIPYEVTQAEKQGFSAPDSSWFKGDSIEFVKRTLMSDNAHIYEFMDQQVVEALLQEHLSGRQNKRLLIWSLLNVEQYLNETFPR